MAGDYWVSYDNRVMTLLSVIVHILLSSFLYILFIVMDSCNEARRKDLEHIKEQLSVCIKQLGNLQSLFRKNGICDEKLGSSYHVCFPYS